MKQRNFKSSQHLKIVQYIIYCYYYLLLLSQSVTINLHIRKGHNEHLYKIQNDIFSNLRFIKFLVKKGEVKVIKLLVKKKGFCELVAAESEFEAMLSLSFFNML